MDKTVRPSWHEYFMAIAREVSTRASCPRASCGAVIVSQDHRILSTGYNGSPSGRPSCQEIGCSLDADHCQTAIHAEVNAVAWAARKGISLEGSRLYLYSDKYATPCRECIKVLVAAGVSW